MSMKKEDVVTFSDEKLDQCIAFANQLMDDCERVGKGRALPNHLEEQRRWLLAEKDRRIVGADAATGEYL
jgi:hypothetical protein